MNIICVIFFLLVVVIIALLLYVFRKREQEEKGIIIGQEIIYMDIIGIKHLGRVTSYDWRPEKGLEFVMVKPHVCDGSNIKEIKVFPAYIVGLVKLSSVRKIKF